jgi:hypothetical protein
MPLFDAAAGVVRDNFDDMPFRSAVRVVLASSQPFPELAGYDTSRDASRCIRERWRTTPEGSVRAERMCRGTTERQHG